MGSGDATPSTERGVGEWHGAGCNVERSVEECDDMVLTAIWSACGRQSQRHGGIALCWLLLRVAT